MTTSVTGSGLHIDLARWPGFSMSRSEVTGVLSFLSHKVKKPVRCTAFRGAVHYAAEQVNVYISTNETCSNPTPVHHVKLNGQEHTLDGEQRFFPTTEADGQYIRDEESRVLAKVDHNCLVFLYDVTAADNEAGRAMLAFVIGKAVPLFNFDVKVKLNEAQAQAIKGYGEFYGAALRSRIDTKTEEVHRLERDSENFYYQLVQAERDLPLAKQELEMMEKQVNGKDDTAVQKQSAGILALIANGEYEEITPTKDGTLTARTVPITIEHNDWSFNLGRYEINIDSAGKVSIFSSDGTDAEGYPHPHVDGAGRPCFGNIAPDVARAIGRMRIAEALTLLHDFISSYNEDGPYIRIGRFDPEYNDPDDNPCEDCGDYHSPYCICDCSHNGGEYSCSDCNDYRSEHCYTECSYNLPGFQFVNPCDPCEESDEHCFLECQYNEKWQMKNPCDDCSDDCENCDYAEKKKELASKTPTRKPVRTS